MEKEVVVLDGDDFRAKTKNVDFSKKGRLANLKLAAEHARKEVDQGKIVICAFISPYREFRKMVKGVIGVNKFIEVFVDSPLEVCIKRDVKGLYKKSLNGTIAQFTGMTDPYEPPLTPHIKLDTYRESISKCVDKIITFLFRF
jgi:adenylylsulfate kinase